ncbi:SH3 domain-containing protein [Oculatella sp. LEGE 06141]
MVGLLMGTFVLSPLALADQGDPNGANNLPQPGWGLWFPRSQATGANFDSGFSNSELGGFMDFEAFCESAGAGAETNYWFRLTTSLYRIGTGSVEYGCWQNGRFVTTNSGRAILSGETVDCLYVRALGSNGLNIRAEPSTRSRILRTVRNGSRVTPSAYPAIIQESEGRNWVEIRSPISGWISDDASTSQGNLTMCDR